MLSVSIPIVFVFPDFLLIFFLDLIFYSIFRYTHFRCPKSNGLVVKKKANGLAVKKANGLAAGTVQVEAPCFFYSTAPYSLYDNYSRPLPFLV
jgi:hypothetical protein